MDANPVQHGDGVSAAEGDAWTAPSRRWRSPFWVLCAVGFLGRLSYEMARSPLTPLYAKHLGAPTELVGLIVAAVTITGIFVKLPSGAFADVFGFRRLMMAGSWVKATGPFLYLPLFAWPQLLIVRFYHGLATALYAPAASATVAKIYPKERAHRLGIYSASENAGVLLGPVIGGAVLAAANFPIAFLVSGAIGVLALLAMQLVPRDAHTMAVPTDGHRTLRETLRSLARGVREIISDPMIRLVSLVEATVYMGVGTLQAYLPLYAVGVHISVAEIGLLFGVQGVVSIVSRPRLGSLSDRVGRRPLIVGGGLVCLLVLIAIPHVRVFGLLLLLTALFGLGTGMVTPSTTAMIGDLVTQGNYGSAMGVFGSLWDTGHASGSVIVGFLIAAWGYQTAFLIVGLVMAAALVVFLTGTGLRPARA